MIKTAFILLYFLALRLFILIPFAAFAKTREITIPQRAVDSAAVDLSIEGKWFIQFAQDDWIKTVNGKRYKLFPDKANRSDQVKALFATVGNQFDVYIFEHINDSDFANGTDKLRYIAACIENDRICHVYTRNNNKQQIIELEQVRETDAAKTAMAAIKTALASLETIATDTGDFQ